MYMRVSVCLCVACVGVYVVYMSACMCMYKCVCMHVVRLCAHVWVHVYLYLCVRVSCVRACCVSMCMGTLSLSVCMGVSLYLSLLITLSLPLFVCMVVHYGITDSLVRSK